MKWIVLASAIALGPSGTEQTPPFKLTDEYVADFRASKPCAGSKGGELFSEGRKAIYGAKAGEVTVYLDEYARRFALDYCWR